MPSVDVVVIGAGHNGLVAGAYLARAGKQVLILERAERPGGILRGSEVAPGFRAPGIAHTVGRLRRSVIEDLALRKHGLELISSDVRLYAPQPAAPGITFWADAHRTAEDLSVRSRRAAEAYLGLDQRVRAIAGFLAHLNETTPPDVGSPLLGQATTALRWVKAFRGLSEPMARETLRCLPMPVADFVGERVRDDRVAAALATRGVLFTACGPRSPGTAAVLINDSAGNDGGAPGTAVFARGGSDAVVRALASSAQALGVQLQNGAEVVAVRSQSGRVRGVALADGTEVEAPVVVSSADPKRTLRLCDPVQLGPTLVWQGENIRQPGATAKIDLALSGLPSLAESPERLYGRIVIAPTIDYIEKAADAWKYGLVAAQPWLELTIPSLSDPTAAPPGKHVMSVLFQAAPRRLRQSTWDTERHQVLQVTLETLEAYAPGLQSMVEAEQVLTPEDLEREYALTGGHVQHAEPTLDQFLSWRPIYGQAGYRFGLQGLYLAGSGAHPGGGVTGAPGANAAREILRDLRRSRRP